MGKEYFTLKPVGDNQTGGHFPLFLPPHPFLSIFKTQTTLPRALPLPCPLIWIVIMVSYRSLCFSPWEGVLLFPTQQPEWSFKRSIRSCHSFLTNSLSLISHSNVFFKWPSRPHCCDIPSQSLILFSPCLLLSVTIALSLFSKIRKAFCFLCPVFLPHVSTSLLPLFF